MKNSIERKLLIRFLRVVGTALAAMLVLFVGAMILIRSDVSRNEQATGEMAATSSAELLREQSRDSNATYVFEKADAIDRRIEAYVTDIRVLADAAEYVYEHTAMFPPSGVVMKPDEQIAAGLGEGNVMAWIPCDPASDNAENRDICQRLGSLYGVLDALLERKPEIALLYLVTKSGFTLGIDDALLMRAGIKHYEARNQDYFVQPMTSGEVFISSVYQDSFGKGDMITVSLPVTVSGKQIGVFAADILVEDLKTAVMDSAVGDIGSATLLSSDGKVICASSDMTPEAAQAARAALFSGERVTTFYEGAQENYLLSAPVASIGWQLAVSVSSARVVLRAERSAAEITQMTDKLLKELDHIILLVALGITLLIALSTALLTFVVRRVCRDISAPILHLTDRAGAIGEGNLDFANDIHTGDEIERLGEQFERMTVSLKEYIRHLTAVTAEKERIGAELSVATQIQASMLPCIFPAFPEREEFEIFAVMNPAKEVGGDFYDFFLVDEDHLALVIADVSGKGVPAALFMVIAKTLIKNNAQAGKSPEDTFESVNAQLCENNDAGMFVTGWMGLWTVSTGELKFVNAGHNPPLLRRAGGAYTYLKARAGFVLAGMEGIQYRLNETRLEPGDTLFLYTDGVTEATDARNELYGEDRLSNVLNSHQEASPMELLPWVKADIDAFAAGAPQFDDITMMALRVKR